MNHNQFDYEQDLIFPLKEFLNRHTGYKIGVGGEINLPKDLFEIPISIKEKILSMKTKNNKSNFSNCFGGGEDVQK
jgi:hypothetical protein